MGEVFGGGCEDWGRFVTGRFFGLDRGAFES